ncbi:helix-turn-helix domain-containing protein [Phyllobacterium sp. 628]|uniref:winged helix-turn-helix domain-containing protein n=1 Tax=Phyllobacterium sp. 628 TaxID=2718938 RepID=UPI00166265DA|nr:winged helix-turn-helix domain-containing protein [Phyllobacterium sp. 628]QND53436.1 helix-turn-helix domain-containing protein [Phyllobacterium sp. 628]
MSACPCCGYDANNVTMESVTEYVHFTKTERKIFDFLCENFGKYVSATEIVEILYGDKEDGGPETAHTIIAVMINHIREKIQNHGLIIQGKIGLNGGRRLVWAADK